MKDKEFIAIDFETTGLDRQNDEIIEVGLARFRDGLLVETYSSFVYTDKVIPENVVNITGISNDTLEHAPKIDTILHEIADFIGELPLVAHNASFDMAFLLKILPGLKNSVVDTLTLSRILLPQEHYFSLEKLADTFGIINKRAHSALYDAIACGELFLKLLPLAGDITEEEWAILLKTEDYNPCGLGVLYKMKTGVDKIPLNLNSYYISGESLKWKGKADLDKIFSEDGYVGKKLRSFENRGEQLRLAKDIRAAFEREEFLITEAGTGTGKTFAYLFPATDFAIRNKERVVISTQTKSLQNQLFYKDLPFVFNYFDGIPSAQILKGRGNYLCLLKWADLLDNLPLLSKEEVAVMQKITIWRFRTKSGDVEELGNINLKREGYLWQKLKCDDFFCLNKNCPFYNECYFKNARRNAKSANIVVVNHSLLFSDAANGNLILGEYDRLIIDEAHNIEKTATRNIGITLTQKEFDYVFNSFARKKSIFIKGIKHFLSKEEIKRISTISSDIISRMSYVMSLARENYEQMDAYRSVKYNLLDELISRMEESVEPLNSSFDRLLEHLKSIGERLENEGENDMASTIEGKKREIEEIQFKINSLFTPYDENSCYLLETESRTKNVKFSSIPIYVGDILGETLFGKIKTLVTTSGTIAVDGDFSYFMKRTGLFRFKEQSLTQHYSSPFDYNAQLKTAICEFTKDPGDPQFYSDVTPVIKAIIQSIPKKTMILTTSYTMLNTIYNSILSFSEELGIRVLAQGISGSRTKIIENFKSSHQGLLIGTDTFWEGIDLPGKFLEVLIIPKLPFPPPNDPIIESRINKIREAGNNPFDEYMVPEMILKLKQGIGRLIRTTYDNGYLFILDSRIYRRNYGKRVLAEIPGKEYKLSSYYILSRYLQKVTNE
ncbi:MAG: DEAD/DEAH box helicase family protein [Proteobacteria bacterium]|nr:DEAD/DEAH box helicase family protein [Pseudomonadota bacterium]